MQRCAAQAAKASNALPRAQLDLPGIVAKASEYQTLIDRRCLASGPSLEYIVSNRPKYLQIQREINSLRQERTQIAKPALSGLPQQVRERLAEIKQILKPLETQERSMASLLYSHAENLPNLLSLSVPIDELKGESVAFINCASREDAEAKMPQRTLDHREIGLELGIMDFNIALRVSGSSWYYLIGDGALLEQALVQYALKIARQHGYTMMAPPSLVRSQVLDGCGFKPRDQNGEKQVYHIEDEDVSLTGTAEIALAAFHSSHTFTHNQQFPVKYAGVSRAYRAEAGARGKDTKGLYRVHEFTKVELFHFTDADKATIELEELRELQTSIIKGLGLMAEMINMPTTDLGAPAMKKYDCEAWMPGRGSWGELTSASNCGTYQLRRLGTKYWQEQEMNHVHTLNGTAMAVPRVIVALIEQGWDEETRSVRIPAVLQPYMDDKERIFKQ